MNEPLSPAAQAVKDAAQELYAGRMARKMAWPLDLPVVAAALRAVADQLTPYSVAEFDGAAMARNRIITIAAELEGHEL